MEKSHWRPFSEGGGRQKANILDENSFPEMLFKLLLRIGTEVRDCI